MNLAPKTAYNALSVIILSPPSPKMASVPATSVSPVDMLNFMSENHYPIKESEEPPISASESDDDLDLPDGLSAISDKRKVQNIQFANWSVIHDHGFL